MGWGTVASWRTAPPPATPVSLRPVRSSAAVLAVLAVFALAACGPNVFHVDVRADAEAVPQAPVPEDSVREIRRGSSPRMAEWIADSIGAPYLTLGYIEALGAGSGAAGKALASLRRNVARIGGNALLVDDVRKMPGQPYTAASGHAFRVLPPMPDAPERCARLLALDSALARIVACREAARQEPNAAAHRHGYVIARLRHFELLHGSRYRAGSMTLGAEANRAGAAALHAVGSTLARDSLAGLSAPLTDDLLRYYEQDSLAVLDLVLLAGPRIARVQATREYRRLAPDSIQGYLLPHGPSGDEAGPAAALARIGVYIRRQPHRHEGWARAALLAHAMEDHALAMRFWERVLRIRPGYFDSWINPPEGVIAYRHWRKRVPKQPPATVDDLPPTP